MRRVIVPENDVHTLVVQLIGHRLYTRAAHTNTRPDRVDTLVVGFHRNLGTRTRVAGGSLDLDNLFGNLRHFNLEQLDEHFRTGAAQHQLRAARLRADLAQNGTHTIVDTERLATHQLIAGQQALGITAEVNNHIVARDFLHGAGNQLAHALKIKLNDLRTLGVAHTLHDHLLGGLSGNAPEAYVLHRFLIDVAGLEARLLFYRFLGGELGAQQRHFIIGNHQPATHSDVVARLAVDRHLNIGILVVALLGRCCQRQLDRLENDVLGHAFFIRDGLSHHQDLFSHS